jgi:hypothetical protein
MSSVTSYSSENTIVVTAADGNGGIAGWQCSTVNFPGEFSGSNNTTIDPYQAMLAMLQATWGYVCGQHVGITYGPAAPNFNDSQANV